MVDFPRVKIVDVNGYKVPVAETQHFTGVGDKTERTSNKTPFPVKDEVARADLKAIKKQTEINKSVLEDLLFNQKEMVNVLSDSAKVFGAYWDKSSVPTLTRTDSAEGMKANVGIDGELVKNDFDDAPIYRKIGEVRDEFGNTFVRIPKFYIRKKDGKDFKLWQISETKYPGFYLPALFWDFTNEKELPYYDHGKYEASLSDENKLESKPGKHPLAEKSIVEFRNYAEANGVGYQQNDVHAIDVVQTLFYIEFATLDSQAIAKGYTSGNYNSNHKITVAEESTNRAIVSNSTAEGYEVDQTIGIGTNTYSNNVSNTSRLITKVEEYDADNKAIYFDGEPVDTSIDDVIANRASITGFSKDILAQSGTVNIDDGKNPFVYRGIENPWGSIYEWVDGININSYQVWVAENAEDYASNVFAEPYRQLGYINHDANGYVKQMGFDAEYPFAEFPVEVGGGTTTYYADYYYRSTGQRVARFGGAWGGGSRAGVSCWALDASSGTRGASSGGRLLRKAL